MPPRPLKTLPDDLSHWIERYQALAVIGERTNSAARKIALHLTRFDAFFQERCGHDKLSACVQRDVRAWQKQLADIGYAPATINNHLANLSGFFTWVQKHHPQLFAVGNPMTGISEMPLPPLEPRALNTKQVQSLKSLCDRLERYYQLKGRRWANVGGRTKFHDHARPQRDRAIVFVLLSTGLRREELVKLNLAQLEPRLPHDLRQARRAKITSVKGKGKTARTVFLSADARTALADYIEHERPRDTVVETQALFLAARGIPQRHADGRLSTRAINRVLEQIGRWHDAEQTDPVRHISPLRPHDLRHTFAFQLSDVTNADTYELERRLGHRSQRYIQRYTNPPESVAATYVEEF